MKELSASSQTTWAMSTCYSNLASAMSTVLFFQRKHCEYQGTYSKEIQDKRTEDQLVDQVRRRPAQEGLDI